MFQNTGSRDRGLGTPAAIDEVIARACEPVPGVQDGALVLLAEGVSLGGIGAGGAFAREPLVRAAVRCLGSANTLPRPARKPAEFSEYAFVTAQQITVIARGKREPRVALVLVCARESNLAFVLGAVRRAIGEIEATAELVEWMA